MFVPILLVVCVPVVVRGQEELAVVQVVMDNSAYTIYKSSTQTETKTPWTVFSFEVGGKTIKYISGRQSQQLMETGTPQFILDPQDATLADYAIIRLVQKKSRRQLPEPQLRDNKCLSIDLTNFVIEAMEDDKFRIRPIAKLPAGEYMLVNVNQKSHGDAGDYYCYCFTIE